MAILLALHCSEVELLGVSTVHGNASADNTFQNACRLLHAFGAPDGLRAYHGASKPLIREARSDPEIHGIDGLGGVQGVPTAIDPVIQGRLKSGRRTRALEAMSIAVRQADRAGSKITVATCGPLTNLALFISVYPDLLSVIEKIVFMGGGVGLGNRSGTSEFNILCDPEAAHIVLNAPIEKIMIPLNVTHTAIFSHYYHSMLLNPSQPPHFSGIELPSPSTPLRHTISTLLTFFAERYEQTFGFHEGPPLHDALTVACIVKPEIFQLKRYRVDIELNGTHSAGQTVVDVWNYKKTDDSWGSNGKNCMVAQSVDVEEFFLLVLECIDRCDNVSPLNKV